MFILSLKHLTTLRLNDTPMEGAMDKGIFVKFEEKLRIAFFFYCNKCPGRKYLLP